MRYQNIRASILVSLPSSGIALANPVVWYCTTLFGARIPSVFLQRLQQVIHRQEKSWQTLYQ